jgi:hypothetical protein
MLWSDMSEFASGVGRQRLPTRDRPDAEPGRLVVRDPWKVSPELNYGRQLAARLVHLTDGRSRRFVDTEHGAYNGRSLRAGQAKTRELAAPNHVGRRVGPGRLGILSGPLAHLGRITGTEIPGTSAEMAVRDMVSNAAPVPASDA